MYVFTDACVSVSVCVSVYVCTRVCVCVCACVHVRVFLLNYNCYDLPPHWQLLAEGTRRLGLQRAAKHLYAADGTRFLTIQQLKAWALNQSLREHHPLKDTDTKLDIHMTDATTSGGTVNRSSP